MNTSFSFAAYAHIRELQDLPASPSSCHNCLLADLAATHSQDSPTCGFIPFLRERNSVGKLLKPIDSTTLTPTPRRQRSLSAPRKTPVAHSPKLRKPRPKGATPGVGTYVTEGFWERKSFCQRRAGVCVSHSPKQVASPQKIGYSPPKPPLVPVYQYVIKEKRPKAPILDKFDSLRPEVALRRMKKTNFQSVKLSDTPEELMESFQFKERLKLKEEKLFEVKRFMRRMLKGKFY